MNPPVATLLVAALHGLLLVALSLRIVLRRRAVQVGIGSGGDKVLARRIRAHANFVEYVPLALLLLALLEACGLGRTWIFLLGGALLLGRLLHATGLSRSAGYSLGRFAGTLLTWLVLSASALAGLVLAARSLELA